MSFSDKFLECENRDGFVVSEVMKRSWAADMLALQDIKALCKRHHIKFFAVYGTLLGTIRHGGYIPWDDDIDIGMLRDDYIAFLNVITDELGDKYDVMNPYTRPWYCMNFSHISNSNDLYFDRAYLTKWLGCPFPVGPDIYPYYYLPRDPAEERYIMDLLEKVDSTMALCRRSASEAADKGFDLSGKLNEVTARALVELQHETGYEFTADRPLDNQLEMLYDQICRLTESEDADFVARYDEYAKDRSKKFPKALLENTVELPFEEMYMPVPVGYNDVLEKRFGSGYMSPKQERGAHDYPFFKKQLRGLGERLDDGFSLEAAKYGTKGEEVKKKTDGRLTVLLHTTVSGMLIYNEYVPDKIKAVLEVFTENCELLRLCWLAADFPKNDDMALDLTAPQLIKEYEEIVSSYGDAGGELVHGELKDLIEACDLYYGDEGCVADAFRKAQKPVCIIDYREKAYYEISNLLHTCGFEKKLTAGKRETGEGTVFKSGDSAPADYPEAWKRLLFKPDHERKKAVLYINTVSSMFQRGRKMLSKLREVLDSFFEKRDDVLLIWHPQKAIEQAKEAIDSEVYDEYESIIEDYKSSAWGILDEGDVMAIAGCVDAYYGDPDPAAGIISRSGKPVMIADINISKTGV